MLLSPSAPLVGAAQACKSPANGELQCCGGCGDDGQGAHRTSAQACADNAMAGQVTLSSYFLPSQKNQGQMESDHGMFRGQIFAAGRRWIYVTVARVAWIYPVASRGGAGAVLASSHRVLLWIRRRVVTINRVLFVQQVNQSCGGRVVTNLSSLAFPSTLNTHVCCVSDPSGFR